MLKYSAIGRLEEAPVRSSIAVNFQCSSPSDSDRKSRNPLTILPKEVGDLSPRLT